jgi:acid phosphatase (class B)
MTELQASLPKGPVDVGFDIDDTLVFPSPSFQAVLFNTDGPGGSNPYGADMRAVVSNPKAWHDVHHVHDRYVIPKQVGRDLLALHQKRGDRIHYITARVGVEGAQLEARMRKIFGVEFVGPIIFTAMKSKTEAMRARNLTMYYGDSDSDIEYAQAAGIRGVRVLRATNAIDYDRRPCFGMFGEEVIIDSDR